MTAIWKKSSVSERLIRNNKIAMHSTYHDILKWVPNIRNSSVTTIHTDYKNGLGMNYICYIVGNGIISANG